MKKKRLEDLIDVQNKDIERLKGIHKKIDALIDICLKEWENNTNRIGHFKISLNFNCGGIKMKIRNGFVSNSSSSSFLAIFAEVSNEKAKEVLMGHKAKKGLKEDLWITNGEEIKKLIDKRDELVDCDWAGVWIRVSEKDINSESTYFLFEYAGNEGDGYFMGEDMEYGEPDYDIDEDIFNEDIQKFMNDITEENGFKKISISYGAGRNG